MVNIFCNTQYKVADKISACVIAWAAIGLLDLILVFALIDCSEFHEVEEDLEWCEALKEAYMVGAILALVFGTVLNWGFLACCLQSTPEHFPGCWRTFLMVCCIIGAAVQVFTAISFFGDGFAIDGILSLALAGIAGFEAYFLQMLADEVKQLQNQQRNPAGAAQQAAPIGAPAGQPGKDLEAAPESAQNQVVVGVAVPAK